jgi:hypothetical protein
VGQAILHIHTIFSDGTATVEQILEDVEHGSEVDIVGFTDHDDVRAYAAALEWKARHPDSRVEPLWGCEVTVWGFKHLLAFVFAPPFPTVPWRKFLPLPLAVAAIHAAGGEVIVPHVDAFWVGLGRRRLLRLAGPLGSDAHHVEDLYQVVVDFPGHTVADFASALRAATVSPRWGWRGAAIPLQRQLRQHARALVGQPSRQLRAWAVGRRAPASAPRDEMLPR